jgi:hypothetical protein
MRAKLARSAFAEQLHGILHGGYQFITLKFDLFSSVLSIRCLRQGYHSQERLGS